MLVCIHRYEDRAFDDMGEGSGKINYERFIIQKPLQPIPSSVAVPYETAQTARHQKASHKVHQNDNHKGLLLNRVL